MDGPNILADFVQEQRPLGKLVVGLLTSTEEHKGDPRLQAMSAAMSGVFSVLFLSCLECDEGRRLLFERVEAFFPISPNQDLGESRVLAALVSEPKVLSAQRATVELVL